MERFLVLALVSKYLLQINLSTTIIVLASAKHYPLVDIDHLILIASMLVHNLAIC